MSIISFQNIIVGVLLSCITVYVVKYVDLAAINILRNRRLTKTLISIDVLIFVTAALLLIDWIICKVQLISNLLNLQ